MAYPTGNFYHTDPITGKQLIDDVVITNSTLNGVTLLVSATVPTTLSAVTGALCICTATGSVGLYINVGTVSVPSWQLFGTE